MIASIHNINYMRTPRVHLIIQLLCIEFFTLLGCGFVLVMQLTVGVLYGIVKREIGRRYKKRSQQVTANTIKITK